MLSNCSKNNSKPNAEGQENKLQTLRTTSNRSTVLTMQEKQPCNTISNENKECGNRLNKNAH